MELTGLPHLIPNVKQNKQIIGHKILIMDFTSTQKKIYIINIFSPP